MARKKHTPEQVVNLLRQVDTPRLGNLPVCPQTLGRCVEPELAPPEKVESPRSGLTKLGHIAQLPKSYEH